MGLMWIDYVRPCGEFSLRYYSDIDSLACEKISDLLTFSISVTKYFPFHVITLGTTLFSSKWMCLAFHYLHLCYEGIWGIIVFSFFFLQSCRISWIFRDDRPRRRWKFARICRQLPQDTKCRTLCLHWWKCSSDRQVKKTGLILFLVFFCYSVTNKSQ